MATRLYLTNAAAPSNPDDAELWSDIDEAVDHFLSPVKLPGDVTTASTAIDWTVNDALCARFISLPIAANVTIDGDLILCYVRAVESAADDNAFAALAAWVTDGTDTGIRGNLITKTYGATELASGGTYTNRVFSDGSTGGGSVAAQIGDRIVVEIGFRSSAGTTPVAQCHFGTALTDGTVMSTDLPENLTETAAYAPWVEFDETITFQEIAGGFASFLPAPTMDADGTVGDEGIEGDFASTLPVPVLAASGFVGEPIEGTFAATLPIPVLNASGGVAGSEPPHGGAKLGTRFLGVGASFAALATDICQEGDDMTATATSITENPAARYDRSAPRTLAAIIEADDTSVGTIFAQDDGGGGLATRLSMAAGGVVEARVDGTLVGSLTLPNIDGALSDYIVGWISIDNPDTTGASDAVLSWLVAHDQFLLESARAAFTHAIKPASTARASWGDDDGAGTNAYSDGIVMAGMHDRRMTLRELVQDWGPLGAPAAPSTEFVQDRMPVPIDLSVGLHAVDELHGPAAAWAAHNHRQLRRRLATPLHVRYPATDPIERDSHLAGETHSSKLRLAVGSQTHRWHLGWLHCWPVPAGCDEAWVEVHAQQWQTVADRLAPISLRCYSINRPPGAIGGLNPGGLDPYEQYFVEATIERDDTEAGPGSHVTLGRLPLARATKGIRKGKTYIVLAYAIDPEETTGFEGFQQLRIHDLHVVPGFRDPVDGGLGFGGLGG